MGTGSYPGSSGTQTDTPLLGPTTFGAPVVPYSQEEIEDMAQQKAMGLLRKSFAQALQALGNKDCLGLFLAPNGSFLKNPQTGQVLNPATVLSVLVHGSLVGVDTGYGTINVVPMGDDAGNVGFTQGSGLNFSWAGPYYSTVSTNFNISD